MKYKTNPILLKKLTSLLKPASRQEKVMAFLKQAKPGTLGPDAMELMVKHDMISTATSYTDKFFGIDAALTRKLLKSRQLLGNFNSHSFVDLPISLLNQIFALTGRLSVSHINLANFKIKDQEAVMQRMVSEFKDDALLNIAQQLATVNGLTNKMVVQVMKYLPPSYSKYLAPVCQNLNKYPLLDKKQFSKDLEKFKYGALLRKYKKSFESK